VAARQHVEGGALLELLTHAHALGHVGHRGDSASHAAGLVGQRAQADRAAVARLTAPPPHAELEIAVVALEQDGIERRLELAALAGDDAGELLIDGDRLRMAEDCGQARVAVHDAPVAVHLQHAQW
jgi:hypothetical protein